MVVPVDRAHTKTSAAEKQAHIVFSLLLADFHVSEREWQMGEDVVSTCMLF